MAGLLAARRPALTGATMETLTSRVPGRLLAVLAVLLAMTAGILSLGAGRSDALAMTQVRSTAVQLAAHEKGKPYVYGADGPGAFDCSGLVFYVYHRRLGVRLPRTANQQWHATHHVAKSQMRRGDLVFFLSGNYAYHVGVYAGHHRIWNAPHPGSHVRLERIWGGSWRAGRVN